MITKKEVEHVAELSRLGLNKKEIEKIQNKFSSILSWFDLLKEVNIKKVQSTNCFILVENVMREDELEKRDLATINKLVKAIPNKKGRYVKVKSVL